MCWGDPGGGGTTREVLDGQGKGCCGHASIPMAAGVSSLWSPPRGVDPVALSLMPVLFQGPGPEGTLTTTAAAAAEMPLSTFQDEDEEASGAPTSGLPIVITSAAPEQGAVTFVSVSYHSLPLTGVRGVSIIRPSSYHLPRGKCPFSLLERL